MQCVDDDGPPHNDLVVSRAPCVTRAAHLDR